MKRIEEIDTNLLLHFKGNPRLGSMIKEGLYDDIEQNGVLVPILVSPVGEKYLVIDGERRRKCALELKLPKLTCIIEDMDEKTKWKRAHDLNVLNRPFTPMESALNFYNRMTRFKLSTREITGEKTDSTGKVGKDSSLVGSRRVRQLVQLVKLPDEVQDLVHSGEIAVEPAYTIAGLAFDVEFPKVKGFTVKKWLSKNPKKSWDFSWKEEDKFPKWKADRPKHQIDLAKRYIAQKFTGKDQFSQLRTAVKRLINRERERREKEGKQKLELEAEFADLQKKLEPTLKSYNDEFSEVMKKINPDPKKRKASILNKYLLDKDNLPKNFDDLLYDFGTDFDKERPNEKRMDLFRKARNTTVIFSQQIKKKDPTIFEITPDPSCPHCGHDVEQDKIDEYFNHADGIFQDMKDKDDVVIKSRNRFIKRLVKIRAGIIDRIEIVTEELEKLEKEIG